MALVPSGVSDMRKYLVMPLLKLAIGTEGELSSIFCEPHCDLHGVDDYAFNRNVVDGATSERVA